MNIVEYKIDELGMVHFVCEAKPKKLYASTKQKVKIFEYANGRYGVNLGPLEIDFTNESGVVEDLKVIDRLDTFQNLRDLITHNVLKGEHDNLIMRLGA